MLLALDVGNTNVHVGVFRDAGLVAHGDIEQRRERSGEEYMTLLAQLLRARGVDPQAIRGAAVASVVPSATATVVAAARGLCGFEPFVLESAVDAGVVTRYDDPRAVGADRIANAVGGFASYGGPLVVVDFGTATTFDAVAADGAFLGGAIAPGLRISLEALEQRTARLPRIELARPAAAIGTNTAAGMQSGIMFGYAGLVEALVGRISRELGGSPTVVATGGLAAVMLRETGVITAVAPHLTLQGLRLICARSGRGRG